MLFLKKTGWLAAAMLVFSAAKIWAQVDGNGYRLMLKTLLSHSVPEVSVEKAAVDSAAVFLDAREKKEFDVSHLAGAEWVGYDDFDTTRVAQLARNQRIIVYCSVGYRSEKVAEKLLAAGFSDVQNLYGGIFEWVNEGRPVVDSSGAKTRRVHAYDRAWGVWLRRGKKVY